MEVSKTNNTMRLSPLLAAMIAATASIGVSKPSRGQTIQSLPDAPQQNSSDVKTPPVVAHGEGLCAEPASAPVLMQSLMGETPKTALHRCKPRGDQRQSLMGGTPKTALPPQDRATSEQAVPETIAVQAKPTTASVLQSSRTQVAVPTKSVVQSVPTTLGGSNSSPTQVAVPTKPTQLLVPVDSTAAELPSFLDAIASGGNQRQSLMGGTPKTALPPQDRAASLSAKPPQLSPDSIEGIAQVKPPNGIEQRSQLPEPTQLEPPSTQPPSDSSEVRVLVAEVLITGAPPQLEEEIYRVIKTRPGRATTRSQLQEDVNAIFATGFFSSVDVQPEDTPLGVRISFIVRANPVLRQVAVKTEPPGEGQRIVNQEKINEIFSEQYGSILNLRDLQEGIKKLNDWYKEEGFDLAQVIDAEQVTPDGTVTLVVAEGVIEAVKVRFIDEDGNPIVDENGNPIPPMTDKEEPVGGNTRPFIITREVELKSGSVFNRKKAQRDLQRVFGLGIFDDVRFSFEPGTDPRQVVIVVDVIEKSSGSIAAGAGLSSASGIFGTVSYQQQNLGGNNQTLGGEFQLGTRELLFDLSFTDPWIAGDPFRTSYTINAFRRRSISLVFNGGSGENNIRVPNDDDDGDRPRVVRTGGGVTFRRPLSQDVFKRSEWTASLGLRYQHVAIEDSDGDVRPESTDGELLSFSDSGEDDLTTVQLGAVRDLRNSTTQPTNGSLLRLGMEQSIPIGSGSILMNRLRASYSFYIPVEFTNFTEGPQALAFNIQGGTILGDLPPYEAFIIGGSNSVRGFTEGDLASGRSFLQATAEYRFPILSVIGGALFVDAGTDLGSAGAVPGAPGEQRDLPGTGLGYGLGVRVQSPLGPIRVDFGLNTEGDSRLHFGIGEKF